MGKIVKLVEIINRIEDLDSDMTIYAIEPWTCASEAALEFEPAEGGLPPDVEKKEMKYFLEVFIAQEFIAGWLKSQETNPSDEEKCERLIYYAVNDA